MTCITNSKCHRVTSLLCYLNMSPKTLSAGSPRFPQVNQPPRLTQSEGMVLAPAHPTPRVTVQFDWLPGRVSHSHILSLGTSSYTSGASPVREGAWPITVASVPSRAACAPLLSTSLTHRSQEHGIRLETSTLVVQGKDTFSESKMISSSEGDPLSHSKGPSPKLVGVGGGKLPSVISRLLRVCICVYIHRYIGR